MVVFPYNATDFAFTLDDVFINFSTTTADTFFDLEITIKYYDFFSSTEKTQVLEYKIPLFNLQQKENVGRKIHRFLSRPGKYENTFGFQYKTAKVSFVAKEIQISDETVVNTTDLNDVKFIPGPKPILLDDNCALLSTNTNPERVTKNGLFIINLLLKSGNQTIKIFKNDIEIATESITATDEDNVFSKKIIVENYSGAQGDVFEVQLINTSIKKSFIVFPDGEHSKQLVFVDNYKLFRSLECTGHFSFPTDYNQIIHKYKRNLVEVLEVIETEKTEKIKVNTGFILKTSTESIDTLLSEKQAYLVENNSAVLDLVPLAKKIVKEDSDAALYEYDLEFQINKKYA